MIVEQIGRQQRQAVRRFASGVAVLTVWQGDSAVGVTVSAVTAVARDPASIAVCLRHDSLSRHAVEQAERFALNVLSVEQERLTGWFASPDRPRGLAQFDCVEWEPDAFSGAPLIAGSLARIGCRLINCIPAGDHDVLLAEVVTASVGEGRPLLSYAGVLHDAVLHPVAREKPGTSAVTPGLALA
ncbi:MAG TPA: flavin reductase family protein [Streptosporangiaceae bacterium]